MKTPLLSALATAALVAAADPAAGSPCNAPPALTPISTIQGAGHVSPCAGDVVATSGIVTAVAFNGYYVQDPADDGNDATSDGIFVFKTGSKPSVGDLVELTDRVTESIPGGAATGNLSTTQLSFPAITVLSTGNALPAPVVIGSSGRIPPSVEVISDDELPVNLQTAAGLFDPENDGIDFYESLEAMLVTVEDPVAVSPLRVFNAFSAEFFTLPNNGADASPADARTARGGINLDSGPNNTGDQNPERVQVQIDQTIFGGDPFQVTLGDRLSDITGVVGYSFGNFEVNVTDPFFVDIPSGLVQEVSRLKRKRRQATLASYNVLNLTSTLSSGDPDASQRALLAAQIAGNLRAPDILALQEIQDNDGTDGGTGSTVTDASQTLQDLVDAIAAAGGPDYAFFDVAPEDDTSGGAPGGNIRNAFLYNPRRVRVMEVLSLTSGVLKDFGVNNPDAFLGTRNPLMGVFRVRGGTITVINNHLSSRFGSTPIFGGPQPFVQAGEAAREGQVQTLNEVVQVLLDGDDDRNVVVLGDFNTFEFTNDLAEILPGSGEDRILTNLVNELPDENAYSFIFDGNSQVLDHMFVTDGLASDAGFDIVHVNNDFTRDDNRIEFADPDVLPASDHDPLLARFSLDDDDDDEGDNEDEDEDEDDDDD